MRRCYYCGAPIGLRARRAAFCSDAHRDRHYAHNKSVEGGRERAMRAVLRRLTGARP